MTAPPLAEGGPGLRSAVSGTSFGGLLQTSPTHTNVGAMGEPGTIEMSGPTYRNYGGFSAALRSNR